MPQRSDQVCLSHILDAVVTIWWYVAGEDQRALSADMP